MATMKTISKSGKNAKSHTIRLSCWMIVIYSVTTGILNTTYFLQLVYNGGSAVVHKKSCIMAPTINQNRSKSSPDHCFKPCFCYLQQNKLTSQGTPLFRFDTQVPAWKPIDCTRMALAPMETGQQHVKQQICERATWNGKMICTTQLF